MKKLKDAQLVWRIKSKRCEKSLLELVSRHSNLFYKISHKYFPFSNRGGAQSSEDMIGGVGSIIYEAAIKFRSNKNVKFSTWLGNFVRYKCLNYLNKNSKYIDADEDHLNYFFQGESLEAFENSRKKDDYLFVLNLIDQFKDPRMKKVFELRYFSDNKKMTWATIGGELEVSAQTAINLHNKGKNILRKKFDSKGLVDKII